MSAATASPTVSARATAQHRVTFVHVLRSEWIKLRSLRSTWWTLGVTIVMMVLLSLLMASQASYFAENPDLGVTFTGLEAVTNSYLFVQLSVAVLGVLLISGEYSTGMIRSTLSAVPTRLPALWAKALVTAAATAVTAVIGLGLSIVATIPMLSKYDLVADLGDSTTLSVLGRVVLCLVLVALLAVGTGTLMRHSAGAIFTLVALLFVIPMVGQAFSQEWVQRIFLFLPTNAALFGMASTDSTGDLSLTIVQGMLVMVAWAAAAMIGASIILKKRDA